MTALKPECKVSIIIPVFNTAAYLPECLDSVLAQTEPSFECILVDDGSTDGSLEIEQAYAARDDRIRIIEQAHLRQGAARNRGLSEARGDYIYFMDSDDIIEPDLLKTCYDTCQADDLDCVTFDMKGFSEEGFDPTLYGDSFQRTEIGIDPAPIDGKSFWLNYFIKGGIIFSPVTYFTKRSLLVDNDIRFAEGIFYEDNNWTTWLILNVKRMVYLPFTFYRRRYRVGSVITTTADAETIGNLITVREIYTSTLDELTDETAQRIFSDSVRVIDASIHIAAVDAEKSIGTDAAIAMTAKAIISHICSPNIPLFSILFETIMLRDLAEKVGNGDLKAVLGDANGLRDALMQRLPFGKQEHVGLYGSGRIARALLNTWHAACGDPIAQITVIDSFAQTGETRLGYPVVNVNDIADQQLDAIVVGILWGRDALKSELKERAGDVAIYV